MIAIHKASSSERIYDIGAYVFSALLFAILLFLSSKHDLMLFGVENDAPGFLWTAKRLLSHHSYDNPFYPPLYMALIALLSLFYNNPFFWGKSVSIAAAAGFVLFTYLFGKNLFSNRTAFFASVLTGTSSILLNQAILVNTDVLFAFFVIVAFYLGSRRDDSPWKFAVAGLFLGLAYLTRHNGLVVLIIFILCTIPGHTFTLSIRNMLLCLGGFLLVTFPYLLSNISKYGNPFYSEQFTNMAFHILPHKNWDDFYRFKILYANGVGFLISNPGRLAVHYVSTAWQFLIEILTSSFNPLVGAVIVLSYLQVWKLKREQVALVFVPPVLWVGASAIQHFLPRFLIPILPMLAIQVISFSCFAFLDHEILTIKAFRHSARVTAGIVLVVLLLILNVVIAGKALVNTVSSDPYEVRQVGDFLRSHGTSNDTVMSLLPQYPYYANMYWARMPELDSRSIAGLGVDNLETKGFLKDGRWKYVGRSPRSAKYFVYDENTASGMRPSLRFLFNPYDPRVPHTWQVVFHKKDKPRAIVYEIIGKH